MNWSVPGVVSTEPAQCFEVLERVSAKNDVGFKPVEVWSCLFLKTVWDQG